MLVLLNFLNKFRKRYHARLAEYLSIFSNQFNKFNNIGAGMLDYIYHMTLKLIKNHIFGSTLLWMSLRNVTKSVNH